MSIFGALNSATAGLRTVQANVKVVSDNIARSDDPARSRHTLSQTIDYSGFVVTAQYRRETDSALQGQVQDLIARDSGMQTRSNYLQKLGDLMGTSAGNPTLNSYAADFSNALKTLETSPESEVASYQFVQAADTFAREIQRVSQGVEDLNREMGRDLETSVDEVNRLLTQVDRINRDIVSLQTQGAAANEVADKRDALIREINEYVGVRTVERPDGRVALFTQSGLALIDSQAAQFSFDGGNINLSDGNKVQSVTEHLKTGKIGALFNMRRDGSAMDPPLPVSSDPSSEVIRKLRSQLDAYADMFVAKTKPGEPTSFADAYDNADPVKDGELPQHFFIGTDRFTLAVHPSLLDNSKAVKNAAIGEMVVAMNKVGRTLTADGLTATDTSYVGAAAAITGNWMTIGKSVQDSAETTKASRDLLTERFHNTTGVNIDEEIALLQQLQTSYAASARVMQVATTMYDTLEAIVR